MTTGKNADALGDYALQGFSIEEPDDHTTVLKHHDEEIARFSQTGATRESLQAQCALHLNYGKEQP